MMQPLDFEKYHVVYLSMSLNGKRELLSMALFFPSKFSKLCVLFPMKEKVLGGKMIP